MQFMLTQGGVIPVPPTICSEPSVLKSILTDNDVDDAAEHAQLADRREAGRALAGRFAENGIPPFTGLLPL